MPPESRSLSQHPMQDQGHSLLLALLRELIHLICAQFCRHCCKATPLEVIIDQDREVSPLKALSETCSALRSIAQPLLHHVPRIRCYSLFLRTIRECPDLADSVKCFQGVSLLEFRGYHSVTQHITKDGFAMIKEVAAELQMITPPEDEPLEDEVPYLVGYIDGMDPILSARDEYEGQIVDEQASALETLLGAINMALLPSLEMFCDWGCFEPLDRHARRRLDRVGRLAADDRGGDVFMPLLHTLIVPGWSNVSWLPEEEEQVYAHVDSRELFFEYMPSVKQFVLNELTVPFNWPAASKVTGQTMWSTLPDLRSVVFDEMIWGAVMQPCDIVITDEEHDTAYQHIRQMAEQCPKLRSFKLAIKQYNSFELEHLASTNPFSPSRLLQSLLPAESRLETLMMHMESVPPLKSDLAVLVGVDLHRFTQLRRLSLDEFCFCRHWVYEEEEEGGKEETGREHPQVCRNNNCLVDMITTSLTSLNVRLRSKPRAVPDIMQLGKAATTGRFPNLKQVTIEAYFYARENGYYSPLIAQPEMQALGPKLAVAFQGSRTTVEVREIPKRLSGGQKIPIL